MSAQSNQTLETIIIATDDENIESCCVDFGASRLYDI